MDFIPLSKTDSRVFWLLKILLGLCLLTPLLMSSSFLFPYTGPKAFAFRILVELAAIGYFYLALKHPAKIFTPLFKGGRGGILSWSVLIFLFSSFLSAVFGVDGYLSWWGNLERMLGVWSLFHFALFFLMLLAVFKTTKDWRVLLGLTLTTGAAVAAVAIIQRVVGLGDLLPQVERVAGTIGNAGYLASYLIFNIFLAAYLLLSPSDCQRRRLEEISYGLALLTQLVALALSGTRGAWLGLAVGAVAGLILFYFFYPNQKVRRYFLISLATIFILAALPFIFRSSDLVQNSPLLKRAASISLADTTTQNRLLLWQKGWLAWQEQPLFGWGPENYDVANNRFFDPRLGQTNAWYDRAHNFIFDYGVTLGWLGLLSYLGLLVVAGCYLFKIAKRQITQRALVILLGSLLLAYLVQNLFIFDTFISYLMLFFVLALINSRHIFLAGSESDKNVDKANVKRLTAFQLSVFLFTVICLLLSVYCYNIKPMLASYRANQILSLPPTGAVEAGQLLAGALALKTFASPEIVYQTSIDYITKIGQAPALAENEDFYKVASAELKKVIERSPAQARNYVALAWLDLYFSNQHRERIGEALVLANKIKELSPTKKDAYLILVAGYALSNQPQKAEEIILRTGAVDDKMGEEVREYYEKLK